jgi:hypothetical protein
LKHKHSAPVLRDAIKFGDTHFFKPIISSNLLQCQNIVKAAAVVNLNHSFVHPTTWVAWIIMTNKVVAHYIIINRRTLITNKEDLVR